MVYLLLVSFHLPVEMLKAVLLHLGGLPVVIA